MATIFESMQWGIAHLQRAGVDSPALDAEMLLAYVLKKERSWIYAHSHDQARAQLLDQYKGIIYRRAKREPVAYILGHQEFYGLDFLVNPVRGRTRTAPATSNGTSRQVLIPRPETEVLVEEAIHRIMNYESGIMDTVVVDVGTGSGAIIISISKTCNLKPVTYFATDIAPAALRIARENARRHGVEKRIKFLRGNLLEPIMRVDFCTTPNPSSKRRGNGSIFLPCLPPGDPPQGDPRGGLRRGGSNLIITANLPYLPTSEWRATAPEIRKWEPRNALDGGSDGLRYYREMFRQVSGVRCQVSVLCEICPEQVQPFKRLVRKCFSKAHFSVKKDLSGRNRVVIVRM